MIIRDPAGQFDPDTITALLVAGAVATIHFGRACMSQVDRRRGAARSA